MNALMHEKSPYLRQHAANPVDWRAWGPTSFEKAFREDKPIFLSIGYSTCHWCHVMAHESFEDQSVAEILNRDFISIKVDREERPDVDRIYMLFVQATTGSGGWPLSVFLTPERKPFFGGTYFPPVESYGRPSFTQLLHYIANLWKVERQKIEDSSQQAVYQLQSFSRQKIESEDFDRDLFASLFPALRQSFDMRFGGFGSAPKFPRPVLLNYLFRYHSVANDPGALRMATTTLDSMAAGGMHDQLGGGFHRYSVDARWFVPHFEKMLYDQSQLAVSYVEAFQATQAPRHAEVARRIFRYVLRDLTGADGAFYSAEDADSSDPEKPSHTGEGAFYIWRQSEIETILGNAAKPVCDYFGVYPTGNVADDPHHEFRGRNILSVVDREADEAPAGELLTRLFEARSTRPRPHLDTKILASWNAQMISAFVAGFLALAEPEYLLRAERAFRWVWSNLYLESSHQLQRRFCDGEAAVPAFLDDYAMLGQAALSLFEATGKALYLQHCFVLVHELRERFEDKAGGFFSSEAGADDLLLRMKEDYDGAEPSGNSVATDLVVRLGHLTGDSSLTASGRKALAAAAPKLRAQPMMAPQMLCALARFVQPPEHFIVRVRDEADLNSNEVSTLLKPYRQHFMPFVSAFALTDDAAKQLGRWSTFLGSMKRGRRIVVYHCHNLACELPQFID